LSKLKYYESYLHEIRRAARFISQTPYFSEPTKLHCKIAKDRAKTFIIFGAQPFQEFHVVGISRGKGKGQVLDIALLHDEHMLRSALQSRKWELIGMS